MLRKSFIVLFFLPICLFASAQTIIRETNVKGTWTKSGSPYYVTNTIHVLAGDSLIIKPGVKIYFTGFYCFYVEGKIKAIGNINDTIYFGFKEMPELDTNEFLYAGWVGIKLNPVVPDTIKFSYCSLTGVIGLLGSVRNTGGAIGMHMNGPLIVNHCKFWGNKAIVGAGIYCNNAIMTVKNSKFEKNTASYGGAIFIDSSSVILSNNTIVNNIAEERGGGIRCSFSQTILISNVIAKNTGRFGAAISLFNDNPKIINNTITDNISSVNGGGLHCEYSNPELTNSILWGNYSLNKNDQIYIYMASRIYVNNCVVDSGIYGIMKFGNIEQLEPVINILYSEDPDLMTNDTILYALSDSSYCIDRGIPVDSLTQFLPDILGNYRIYNDTIDIGAYESGSSPKPEPEEEEEEEETGINSIKRPNAGLTIYPNPCNGRFYIKIDGNKEPGGTMLIMNALGQYVYKSYIISDQFHSGFEADITLKSGIYFVEVLFQNTTVCGKVIVD